VQSGFDVPVTVFHAKTRPSRYNQRYSK
jgi:hypothetical protein